MINQSACELIWAGVVSGVRVVDTPEELKCIYDKDAQAVIWQRKPAKSFQDWIDNLDPENLPSVRMIIHSKDACQVVTELCNSHGLPDSEERVRLINDVSVLTKLFSDLMVSPYLKLRLDVVQNNACRKFHIDAVTARLICTYRGQGTQYGTSVGGGEPEQVYGVDTGCPVVIKGTQWTGNATPKERLLHRSPPIEETGETRLLLVLDPAKKPEGRV